MKTLNGLHTAGFATLFLAAGLMSAAAFAGDDTSRYDDKGGAVTHPQWAHGHTDKNYGVVNQVRMAEERAKSDASSNQSDPGASDGSSTDS